MLPVSGQFHTYSTKSTSKRLADSNSLAGFLFGGDIEEQAHPSAAMLDDYDRVIASERAREADLAGCWDHDCCAAIGVEDEPARANAVRRDRAETFCYCGVRGEAVVERRGKLRLGHSTRTSGRRWHPGE